MPSPWVDLPRDAWARLARQSTMSLDECTVHALRSLKDPTDTDDVREVYLPLTQLINFYRRSHNRIWSDVNDFLDISPGLTPFVVGVAGSVAVGKSTAARLLRELLAQSDDAPVVDLVTTDGFLYPNAVLEAKGILDRKGFPESYDRNRLLEFIVGVKSGRQTVKAPVYSHDLYDIVPDQFVEVSRPDILIVEGLNVLQPAALSPRRRALAVSDFFDFSVYVDADPADIRTWFTSRFLALRDSAFQDPTSYFQMFASLGDDEAIRQAHAIWDSVNAPNLVHNIEPTKRRATVILRKGNNHLVERVQIRKI